MKRRFFEDLSDLERSNLADIITEVNNDSEKSNKLRSYLRDQGISSVSPQILKALGFKELTKAEKKRNLERLVLIRKV